MFVLATLLLLCKAENGRWKLKFIPTTAIIFQCDHLVFIKKQFEGNAYFTLRLLKFLKDL